MNLLLLLFASILTGNIALSYFLGMCPFIAISRNIRVAFGMGLAVSFVMTVTAIANWVIHYYILLPFGLEYLQFLIFIINIATIVQILEIFIDRFSPALYHAFGIFLPLITVNCAILGVSLFMVLRAYNLLQTLVFSFGSGIGWMLAIVTIGALRNKLIFCDPPENFEAQGITAILAGIMALAFIGFTGITII
jgi:Na+-transporting NADH:ubiquinone oxidoreductase subunit E